MCCLDSSSDDEDTTKVMMQPVHLTEEPIILAQLVDAKTLNESVTKKSHSMDPDENQPNEIPGIKIESPGPVFGSVQNPNKASFNPKVSEIKKPTSWNKPAGSGDNPPPSYRSTGNIYPPEHNFDLSMDNENPVLMSTMDENSTQVRKPTQFEDFKIFM